MVEFEPDWLVIPGVLDIWIRPYVCDLVGLLPNLDTYFEHIDSAL